MTGPEHYAEAERLLKKSDRYDPEVALVFVQQAQVHAALALAAATAIAGGLTGHDNLGVPEYPRWVKAVSA